MKILVAPLNWGLGHATRCIPIIKILKNHCEVIIASDGRSGYLLRAEFPFLKYYELPTYDITYKEKSFTWMMLRQAPKTIRAIRKENRVIDQIVKKESISAIISDNRFGCYHKRVRSVFLSHQLFILAPLRWLNKITNKVNRDYISDFDEVWIPDFKQNPGMAGALSHNHKFDSNFLGILSRMEKYVTPKTYDICIVLSGPEPKRTELETELISKARRMKNKKIVVVQGKTDEENETHIKESHLEIVNYMTYKELNDTLLMSRMIVSRSGYSTIMDLYRLNSKALLIPTPGQTEQEFLANNLKAKNICEIQNQGQTDLDKAFNCKDEYSGFYLDDDQIDLSAFLKEWLSSLDYNKNVSAYSNMSK